MPYIKPSSLTQKRLREVFSYDSETGLFTNLVRHGARKVGERPGHLGPLGYWIISIDKRAYTL